MPVMPKTTHFIELKVRLTRQGVRDLNGPPVHRRNDEVVVQHVCERTLAVPCEWCAYAWTGSKKCTCLYRCRTCRRPM